MKFYIKDTGRRIDFRIEHEGIEYPMYKVDSVNMTDGRNLAIMCEDFDSLQFNIETIKRVFNRNVQTIIPNGFELPISMFNGDAYINDVRKADVVSDNKEDDNVTIVKKEDPEKVDIIIASEKPAKKTTTKKNK